MASAKKCDRCESYYDYGVEKFSLTKTSYSGIFSGKSEIDLCPECCESFNKWMEEPKIPVA